MLFHVTPLTHPQARDVYEEAIRTVMTVRDFTQVFDSYAQFEESMIAAKMETTSELGREEEGELRQSGLVGRVDWESLQVLGKIQGPGTVERCVLGQAGHQGGRMGGQCRGILWSNPT